ncbi:hypothetical protein EON67_02235, partial [archaeon]
MLDCVKCAPLAPPRTKMHAHGADGCGGRTPGGPRARAYNHTTGVHVPPKGGSTTCRASSRAAPPPAARAACRTRALRIVFTTLLSVVRVWRTVRGRPCVHPTPALRISAPPPRVTRMLEDEEVPTPLQAGGAHTVRTLPSGPAHAVRAPASGAPSRVRSAGRPADPRLHADEVMIASPTDASSARWHGATAPHASHAPHAASYFGSRHGSVGDPVAACNMAPVPARVAAAAYTASLPLPDAAMAGRIRSRAEAMRVRAAEQSAGAARTGARGATAASTTSGAPRSRRQRDFMSLMGSVFQHMSEEELAERLSHLYITRQHESLTDKLAGHDELLRAFRRGFIGPETITAFQAERRAAQSPSVRTLLSAMYARIDKRVRSLMLEEARRVLQQMRASQRAEAEGEGMSASGGAASGAV